MKLLVALFALTAVTGGQAVTIREAPSSEPKLRMLMDEMFVFGRDAYVAIVGTFEKIIFSVPSTIVSTQLARTYEKLREHEAELPPEIREGKETVWNAIETVMTKGSRAFDQWNQRYEDESEGVRDALELYVDPVASKALWCVEWVKENVRPAVVEVYEAFERSMDQALESLNSKVSAYVEGPQAKELEEFAESLHASVVEADKKLQLGLETLNKHLKPYWIPFLEEFKKYKPALREWMQEPLFPAPKED